jgi:hypothetical protein
MGKVKGDNVVTVLGDLVRSRAAVDRRAVHKKVLASLADVNRMIAARSPLRVTVGDEFQGVYARLGEALAASFMLRVDLAPDIDVRFGIARGSVEDLDLEHGIQDGSAWWAAREAIERTEAKASRSATRTARTGYLAPGDESGAVLPVQAALDCLDYMVGSLSDTSLTILEGLMNGRSQQDIAQELGVSASAVSQRVHRDGIGVILEAVRGLRELR